MSAMSAAERGEVMSKYANKVVVYQARDGWRWRAVARNGNIVADSGQKFGLLFAPDFKCGRCGRIG